MSDQQPPGFEAVLPVITRPDDDPGPDAATYHPSQKEPMTETEPTRAQIEAMEKALGCAAGHRYCFEHRRFWDNDPGCPVAVAAARHEAAAVAAERTETWAIAASTLRDHADIWEPDAERDQARSDRDRAEDQADNLAADLLVAERERDEARAEVARLRLGVDYTDEGSRIVMRQLTDTRRERDEAQAALDRERAGGAKEAAEGAWWRMRYEDTRAALDRVRALHEDSGGWCCGDHGQEGALWPCSTLRAIDGPRDEAQRDPVCVKQWPECVDGDYDPACCRFPKSCSCGPS